MLALDLLLLTIALHVGFHVSQIGVQPRTQDRCETGPFSRLGLFLRLTPKRVAGPKLRMALILLARRVVRVHRVCRRLRLLRTLVIHRLTVKVRPV